jgi:hypothetical protein
MANPTREAEVAEVDVFLAETKRLRGPAPEWAQAGWRTTLQAVWVVEDVNGVARAQLRFGCRKAKDTYPTINLIFRNRPIWRIEIEDPPMSHTNPPWAWKLGRPAVVRGSHEHCWEDNRDHVLRIAPDWDIPCRRPLQKQVRRLPQALATFAKLINLEIDSEQRSFDVPPQSEMF